MRCNGLVASSMLPKNQSATVKTPTAVLIHIYSHLLVTKTAGEPLFYTLCFIQVSL